MRFGRALMEHPECVGEFDEKDELECRCYPLYAKILLLKLKNSGKHGCSTHGTGVRGWRWR